MKKEVKIYVYGSCHFSERTPDDNAVGNGGYGVAISFQDKETEQISGGFSLTTNARMDIMGITAGLKSIKEPSKIVVYSTNGYVIDTLTKGWLEKWKKTGFKKKKHVDLWKELDKVLQKNIHEISYKLSKEVHHTKEFQLAEQLGKTMSGKKGLPNDLGSTDSGPGLFDTTEQPQPTLSELEDDAPILDSVCVDASTMGNPGVTEYRGVDTKTGQILFQHKYEEATNNIGEFLAIVHALAHFKKQGKELNILYSDSAYAISWVKQKKCKTEYVKTEKNSQLFDDIQRAVTWLENNTYNTKILKWKTSSWGEIPADYGRK